jgi:hypothetical protein
MRAYGFLPMSIVALLCIIFPRSFVTAQSLKERNEILFEQLERVHGLSEGQMDSIRALFRESGYIGQGNPAISEHPLTPQG